MQHVQRKSNGANPHGGICTRFRKKMLQRAYRSGLSIHPGVLLFVEEQFLQNPGRVVGRVDGVADSTRIFVDFVIVSTLVGLLAG